MRKYILDNLPRQENQDGNFSKKLLPEAKDMLNTFYVVASEYGKSQTQVAINQGICKGTVPIPGARTIEQAHENLEATGWSLRQDVVEELDAVASKVSKPII